MEHSVQTNGATSEEWFLLVGETHLGGLTHGAGTLHRAGCQYALVGERQNLTFPLTTLAIEWTAWRFAHRARVQRGPSKAARCASTGNRQASLLSFLFPLLLLLCENLLEGVAKVALDCAHRTSTVLSCAFCEQGGHLATPYPTLASPSSAPIQYIFPANPLAF